jgi:LIM domain
MRRVGSSDRRVLRRAQSATSSASSTGVNSSSGRHHNHNHSHGHSHAHSSSSSVSSRCHECKGIIAADEQKIRANHHVFHLDHFTCTVCKTPLHGNKFRYRSGKFVLF